jgi:aerobic-type carbon monoxide dehydrogenase small subunit (CoxS/CutS family)
MATPIKVNGVDRTVDVDSDTPVLCVLRNVKRHGGFREAAICLDVGPSRVSKAAPLI